MPARVVCVGHSALDRVFTLDAWPPPGTSAKVPATSYAESGGGMAANAAVAVARLGGAAAFVGPVGDDAVAEVMRAELERCGVDASGMRRMPARRSSTSVILVDARGERLIVNYRGDAVASGAEWLPLDRIGGAAAVLVDVRWVAGAEAALRHARAAGVPTVLDADVAPARTLAALVPLAEHAIFSEPGLAAFAAGRSDAEALRAALAAGARVAGVTRGAAGFEWIGSGTPQVQHVPAPVVRAVDTTGAGDVFHGAYALAIAEGRSVGDAALFACVAAALKCEHPGARSVPTRAQVEALADRAA
ncbi:MAG: PfkB family carbohydrate kinase [Burkholderiales bacterium]|nr:PfkB family carbohydrate kinase [Burkholderiales bacterium]